MADRRTSIARQADSKRRLRDRRLGPRLETAAGMRFLRAGSPPSEALTGELLNASSTGLRILLDTELAVGERLLMEATIGNGPCLSALAEIIWMQPTGDGRYEVGCEFCIDLNARQAALLRRLAKLDTEPHTPAQHA